MERRKDPPVQGRGAQSGAAPTRFGLARREADGDWKVVFDKGCDVCNCAATAQKEDS